MSGNNHNGVALEPGRVFWVSPPPEIGSVSSQFSTVVEEDKTARHNPSRKATLILFAVAALVAAPYLFVPNSMFLVAAAIPACLGILGLMGSGKHECSYVGESGVARFPRGYDPSSQPGIDKGVFMFEKADTLFCNTLPGKTGELFAGQYSNFQWVDRSGKPLWALITQDFVPGEPIPVDRRIHFMRASERAWTRFVLPKLRADIASLGVAKFNLRNLGLIVLTPSELRIETNGETTTIAPASLNQVVHGAGEIAFVHGLGEAVVLDPFTIGNLGALEAMIVEVFGLTVVQGGLTRVDRPEDSSKAPS